MTSILEQELIQKSIEIFKDYSKFMAFFELANMKGKITDKMAQDSRNKIFSYFNGKKYEHWVMEVFNSDIPLIFKLVETEFILELHNIYSEVKLFANFDPHQYKKINEGLAESNYNLITSVFGGEIDEESGYFNLFDNKWEIDGNKTKREFYNQEELLWFSTFKVEEFKIQVIEKVESLLNNDKFRDLLLKLDTLAKKTV